MTIGIITISAEETPKLLLQQEGHFCDLKAIAITPAKLSKTISALSNAEGGEVYIGITEDKTYNTRTWIGFESIEQANGHLQAFEELFPLGEAIHMHFYKAIAIMFKV